MAAETKTGFQINGTIYQVPGIETLSMDENEVLFNLCGLTQEDFSVDADLDRQELAQRMRNPGFTRALTIIAYRRAHPDMPFAKVTALVGGLNRLETFETLSGDEPEEEAVPLASTSEPANRSQSEPLESKPSSGNGSTASSDEQEGPPATTTTGGSATSSPLSPLEQSAI